MKNFLKGTLAGSLLASLIIHFGLLGSVTIDWHLAEQWAGLKAALAQIAQKLEAEPSAAGKAQALAQTAVQEVEQTVASLLKGEKLRLGPDAAGWKQLDQRLAQEKTQAEQEAKQKQKELGGGTDPFSRFISPPVEVELVEAPPQPEPEKGSGIELAVDFKKDNCSEQDPKVKTYGGIGLQFAPVVEKGPTGQMMVKQPVQYQVNVVPAGYPADKAGIKVGDIIEGNPLRFRGEIGSSLTVQVIRRGQVLNFNLTRVKICYEAPPTPVGVNNPQPLIPGIDFPSSPRPSKTNP
jgi:hypothetical protein